MRKIDQILIIFNCKYIEKKDIFLKNNIYNYCKVINQDDNAIYLLEKKNNSKEYKDNNLYSLRDDKVVDVIYGDDLDYSTSTNNNKFLGNGTIIRIDKIKKNIEIENSITGLPPLFLFENKETIIITSNLCFLLKVPGIKLNFNYLTINDLISLGYSKNYKTLFRQANIIRGGIKLNVSYKNDVQVKEIHQSRSFYDGKIYNWGDYINKQIEQFEKTIEKIETRNSLVSLTAGLDTRTIISEMHKKNKRIKAYTMCGEKDSLDAIIAKRICDKYDLSHKTIRIDQNFYKNIYKYINETIKFTGGMYGIEDSTKTYFYKNLTNYFDEKIDIIVSGYLGNQVGRWGRERIASRKISDNIISKEVKNIILKDNDIQNSHTNNSIYENNVDFDYILKEENINAMLNSYLIGGMFVLQRSPYANNISIELAKYMFGILYRNGISDKKFKRRDLLHRILGESEITSFQRKIINKNGGYFAECGINWGWRPIGGLSLKELKIGLISFLDAITEAKVKNKEVQQFIRKNLKIKGLHNYKNIDLWFKKYLKDYFFDSIYSEKSVNSGILDLKSIEKLGKIYFEDLHKASYLSEMCLALNIAKAAEIYSAEI